MAIEFRCSQCGKLLRVGDDAAGKHARCPNCAAVQAVPAHDPQPASPFGAGLPSSAPAAPAYDQNPYGSPTAATWHPQPASTNVFQPTRIDAGDVFARTWEIFKSQFGIILGASAIFYACGLVMLCPALAILSFAAGAGGRPQPNPLPMFGALLLLQVFLFLFDTWLQTGLAIFMLKIARGQTAELADLFSGGRFWPQVVLERSALFVAVAIGELFCLIPGLIAALMFSQYLYLVIDRGQGGFQSLRMSSTLTYGNKLNLVLLALIMMAVAFAGQLACCVGIIPAFGFINLMWAVAYVMMTGQPTADELLLGPPTPSGVEPDTEFR